jgi:bifunctional non-homologous end joining protein LigD
VIPRYVPPFHREGWLYEEKVDAYRMRAYKDGARAWLISRNNVDYTDRYPKLAAAVADLPASRLVLDAEVAVFDSQLRSRFDWLRERPHNAVATLPVLIAFDLLYIRGRKEQQVSGRRAFLTVRSP